MKMYDLAIADCDAGVRLSPKNAESYNIRGCAYAEEGRLDKAANDFSEAIRFNPKFSDAYRNRGNVYVGMDKLDKAIANYNEAIRLNPNDVPSYHSRGYVYVEKGKLDNAIADYDAAIRLNPNDADSYCLRGDAYAEKGQFDKNVDDIETAIRLNPRAPSAVFENWPKAPVSTAALRHGERQVCRMIGDRPAMGQYGDKAAVLYKWAARKFAGEDMSSGVKEIFWDAANPPTVNADSLYPTRDGPGFIRVAGKCRYGPDIGKERSFEELWCSAVFELYNIANANEFSRVNSEAANGKTSGWQYAAKTMAVERRAAEKTRDFYLCVFLPWAKEHHICTHPHSWFVSGITSAEAVNNMCAWQDYENQRNMIILDVNYERSVGSGNTDTRRGGSQ
jgi:tetratricopeptide (TPR) repeat protein